MHAWTKTGEPTKHLEPWGMPGSFSTLCLFANQSIPFRQDYLQRLIDSATLLQQSWIPNLEFIEKKLDEYLSISTISEGLVRFCLFEDSIGISHRPAVSNGKPVEGWLIKYRRPMPTAKTTQDKELYGKLSELDLSMEDWIIIDPFDNDIRESATSNLIFVGEDSLVIPEKRILQGVILRNLLPKLSQNYTIIRSTPIDQEIYKFKEIILCGTGRGVAPLTSLPELGWSASSNDTFKQIRELYEQLISPAND
jgi:branched-subunit amino acid aminotransferase/4-amino-4-deoxychorismate lyase